MKILGQLILFAGAASVAFGGGQSVPEIDPGSAVSAIALATGSILILRSRLRK
jgi:hypothetical protein